MPNQDFTIREQYLQRLAQITLRTGRITAMFGIPIITFFAIQDRMALGMDNTLLWRGLGFFPWAIFLALSFRFFKRKSVAIIPVHMLALLGTMMMMAGIAYIIFAPGGADAQNKFGVIAGYIVAIACIFVVSAGARRYLPWIISIPLSLLVVGLLLTGELSSSDWLFVSNVIIISVFVSVIAVRQERIYYREYRSRKLLEMREAELEEEVQRRMQVEEQLRTYQNKLEQLVAERTQALEIANKELAMAKEEAESMNLLKSNFLANLKHEIRTPLNGILGIAQLMDDQLDLADVPAYGHMLNQSGKRLMRTLNSIINLSKLESDSFEVALDKVEMAELVENEVDLFRAKAQKKGLQLTVEKNTEEVHLFIDQDVLQEILFALLDNALKFTQEGGVTVSYGYVIAGDPKSTVYLRVEDTGVGIDEEARENIFTAFRQGSEGYKRNFEGLGLGLSLVNKYVIMLQGQISLKSTKDKGSTFEVVVPVNQAQLTQEVH